MDIVEKIKKLIAVRDHPNTPEGEVITAAQAITKLLYQYNIEEKDIGEQEKLVNPITMEEIPYKCTLMGGKWYGSLVAVITNNNLCKCLISQSYGSNGRLKRDTFQIIGRKNNIEIVKYMIDSFVNRFYAVGKQKYKLYRGELTENKFLRSFLEGCAAGLNSKYKEMQKQYEYCNALIVKSDNEIAEYLQNWNIKKGRASKEKIDDSIYHSGYETGKNTEINKGITNNRKLLR